MPTPVDSRITPSLHAETLKAIDGYDEQLTAPILAPALEALDDAYITLGRLHDGRAAASKATGSWFAMAISKAAPSRCFDRVAPPTARLCSGLR